MLLQKAMAASSLLAYRLNGDPLPRKHGYPLRVLGTGTYGMKNPKWLTHIEVAAAAPDGFWEKQGWDPDAPVQTMSRIDAPGSRTVAPGDVLIQGIAFAGDRGVQGVEVSTDKGQTWRPAELQPALGPLTWVFWKQTASLSPGSYDVWVRATDAKGQPQNGSDTDSFPSGASGYHKVRVRVVASR